METCTVRFEAWIPAAGFQLERRKGTTPEGAALETDWLVAVGTQDDLAPVQPCSEEPCLHRVLAACRYDRIVHLAGLYGLLTATGKHLPPEPIDIWHREIRAMRNAIALWDASATGDAAALRRILPQHQAAKEKDLFRLTREHLAKRVTEKMAGARFELIAEPDFALRCRPARLIDALWQRVAEEISGLITCAKCPGCGNWFLHSAGRSDRRFCSHPCQMRGWRAGRGASRNEGGS
jgi:hypothetical protein